jgi:hypothetical protein
VYTINDNVEIKNINNIDIVLDRLTVKDYSDDESADNKRLKDSLELAYKI